MGLDLPKPIFAHGQLYAALSRATTEEGVRVKLQETEEKGFHNGMASTQNGFHFLRKNHSKCIFFRKMFLIVTCRIVNTLTQKCDQ